MWKCLQKMWKCAKLSNIARQKKKKKKVQLTKDDAFLYWSSSCAVSWWPIFRKLGTLLHDGQFSGTCRLGPRLQYSESVQEILQWCLSILVLFRQNALSPRKKKTKDKPGKKKGSTHQRWCLSLLVLFLCSVLVANFQEAWHLLHDGQLVA